MGVVLIDSRAVPHNENTEHFLEAHSRDLACPGLPADDRLEHLTDAADVCIGPESLGEQTKVSLKPTLDVPNLMGFEVEPFE